MARALDGDAVGHGIREGHPDLDDIRRRRDRLHMLFEAVAAGKARGEVGDQRRLTAGRRGADRGTDPFVSLGSSLLRQQCLLQCRHVLVAAAREAYQHRAAGVARGPALCANEGMRTLERGQDALALAECAPPPPAQRRRSRSHSASARRMRAARARARHPDSRGQRRPSGSPGSGRSHPAAARSRCRATPLAGRRRASRRCRPGPGRDHPPR